jgi:hypothetical protein
VPNLHAWFPLAMHGRRIPGQGTEKANRICGAPGACAFLPAAANLRSRGPKPNRKQSSGAQMYEIFDQLLASKTWHLMNPADEKLFYETLDKVIWSDPFSPDHMRAYMRKKSNLKEGDGASAIAKAIDNYATDAWAVKDFIDHTGLTKAR